MRKLGVLRRHVDSQAVLVQICDFIKLKGSHTGLRRKQAEMGRSRPPEQAQKSGLFWASPWMMHSFCTLLMFGVHSQEQSQGFALWPKGTICAESSWEVFENSLLLEDCWGPDSSSVLISDRDRSGTCLQRLILEHVVTRGSLHMSLSSLFWLQMYPLTWKITKMIIWELLLVLLSDCVPSETSERRTFTRNYAWTSWYFACPFSFLPLFLFA